MLSWELSRVTRLGHCFPEHPERAATVSVSACSPRSRDWFAQDTSETCISGVGQREQLACSLPPTEQQEVKMQG